MFGKITMAATAAAVLTAAPAFAATENPVGGQMGGMWTQEAPTQYLNTEMGAVLAPRVQYISANGGGLNFRMGLGSGTEVMAMAQLGLAAGGASSFGANLGAGYKQQLTRAGNMAMAFRLSGMLSNLGGPVPGTAGATAAAMAAAMGAPVGGGGVGVGVGVGLPITFDIGTSLLSIYPNANFPALTAGTGVTTGATIGVPIGIQAPLANFWSLIADVAPTMTLGTNALTFPVTVGARLSPAATSHVDFTIAQIPSFSPFGLSAGILGVTGHVGFR